MQLEKEISKILSDYTRRLKLNTRSNYNAMELTELNLLKAFQSAVLEIIGDNDALPNPTDKPPGEIISLADIFLHGEVGGKNRLRQDQRNKLKELLGGKDE